MVILFLTNGLEPAKDGVGDHTRVLAAECIRRGHTCHLMALNDTFISEPVEAVELLDGASIATLRLPVDMSWEDRVKLACKFLAQKTVDWVSLQFVCYGFNPKGIVRHLERHLAPIIDGRPLHMMFHETWIGVDQSVFHKHRLVGQIQRHYIRRLVNRLNPRLVTTSNYYYRSLLTGLGISALVTPLLSNIPFHPLTESDLPEALLREGICDKNGTHSGHLMGLFFGAIHPAWRAEPFMTLFSSLREKTGKSPCLISAGRVPPPGKLLWEKLQREYSPSIQFVTLGELPVQQVSALMQIADFGLSIGAWKFIGKSGAVTSMLDHGLPVLVTDYDTLRPGASPQQDDPLLHRVDASMEAKLLAGLPRRAPRNRGPVIADQLIELMLKSTPPAWDF